MQDHLTVHAKDDTRRFNRYGRSSMCSRFTLGTQIRTPETPVKQKAIKDIKKNETAAV